MTQLSWEDQLAEEWAAEQTGSHTSRAGLSEPLGKSVILSRWLESRIALAGNYWRERSDVESWNIYTQLFCLPFPVWSRALLKFAESLPLGLQYPLTEICELLCLKECTQKQMFASFKPFIATAVVAVILLRRLLENLAHEGNGNDDLVVPTMSRSVALQFGNDCLESLPQQLTQVKSMRLREALLCVADEIKRRRRAFELSTNSVEP